MGLMIDTRKQFSRLTFTQISEWHTPATLSFVMNSPLPSMKNR